MIVKGGSFFSLDPKLLCQFITLDVFTSKRRTKFWNNVHPKLLPPKNDEVYDTPNIVHKNKPKKCEHEEYSYFFFWQKHAVTNFFLSEEKQKRCLSCVNMLDVNLITNTNDICDLEIFNKPMFQNLKEEIVSFCKLTTFLFHSLKLNESTLIAQLVCNSFIEEIRKKRMHENITRDLKMKEVVFMIKFLSGFSPVVSRFYLNLPLVVDTTPHLHSSGTITRIVKETQYFLHSEGIPKTEDMLSVFKYQDSKIDSFFDCTYEATVYCPRESETFHHFTHKLPKEEKYRPHKKRKLQ